MDDLFIHHMAIGAGKHTPSQAEETDSADSGRKRTSSRRNYLRLMGTGVAAGLAGCSGGNNSNGGTTGGASSSVSLTFWHTEPETERANTIAAQVKKFEKENSGVTVNVQPVDEEQIGPETLANAQAGSIPNAIMSPTRFTHLLGDAGLLAPDAHANVIDEIGRDRFRAGPLNMSSSGNKIYAVPHDCFVEVTWFRSSKFEELGLEVPETWDQHLTAAKELHKPNQDQYGISMGTGKNNITNQHFQMVALSHNAQLFNDSGKVTFNTPEMIEALDFYGKISQYTPPGTANSEDNYATYLDELTYQVMQTTYMTDDIYNRGGEEMLDDSHLNALMKDGSGNQGTFGLTQGFNIFNADNAGITSKEVSLTEDLLTFLFKPKQYIPWLHLAPGGFRPTINGIASTDRYQDNKILQAWDKKWQDAVSNAINSDSFGQFGFTGGHAFPKVGNITGNYLPAEAAKAVIDGKDPKAVAKKYQTKMENALK